jgi:hypothetical protein
MPRVKPCLDKPNKSVTNPPVNKVTRRLMTIKTNITVTAGVKSLDGDGIWNCNCCWYSVIFTPKVTKQLNDIQYILFVLSRQRKTPFQEISEEKVCLFVLIHIFSAVSNNPDHQVLR